MAAIQELVTSGEGSYSVEATSTENRKRVTIPLNTLNTEGVDIAEYYSIYASGFTYYFEKFRAVANWATGIPDGTTGTASVRTRVVISAEDRNGAILGLTEPKGEAFQFERGGVYDCEYESTDDGMIPCAEQGSFIFSGKPRTFTDVAGYNVSDPVSIGDARVQGGELTHRTTILASDPSHGFARVSSTFAFTYRNTYEFRDDKLWAEYIASTADQFGQALDAIGFTINPQGGAPGQIAGALGARISEALVQNNSCAQGLVSDAIKEALLEALPDGPTTRANLTLEKFGIIATLAKIVANCYAEDPPAFDYDEIFDIETLFSDFEVAPISPDPLVAEIEMALQRQGKAIYAFAAALDAFERLQGATIEANENAAAIQLRNYFDLMRIVEDLSEQSASFYSVRFPEILGSLEWELSFHPEDALSTLNALDEQALFESVSEGAGIDALSDAQKQFVVGELKALKGFVANNATTHEENLQRFASFWTDLAAYAETDLLDIIAEDVIDHYIDKFGQIAIDDFFATEEDEVLFGNFLRNDHATMEPLRIVGIDGQDFVDSISTSLGGNAELHVSADGSFTFTPAADFFGELSVTYEVLQDDGSTDSADVRFTVMPLNDGPIAVDDSYCVKAGEVLTVASGTGLLANDSDADDDTLQVQSITASANGLVNFSADGSFTYTPDVGFVGQEVLTYTVTDGIETATAVVTIDIESDDTGLIPITGTEGNDYLVGTDANELLDPLGGRIDVLTGGGGADVFDFAASVTNGAREIRTITDFETSVDVIEFGAASVVSSHTFDNRTYLFLDGDRDVILLNGVSEFEVDYLA